jgi:predicted RNA-binding Zn-ribbon protein involved in translation (DUF1610 family)
MDRATGEAFCLGCGRPFEPYELGVDEVDPWLDATEVTVNCPECGRVFVMRTFCYPTAERIVMACGHRV